MLIVTFVVQVIVVAIFHYYNLQFQEVFVHNRPVFEFFSYTTMEGNQKIDYFAYAVPYKNLDITIISTRFPYSKQRVESVLASTRTDGSISSQAISAWLTKPVSLLEECAFVLDYVHILTESK